MSLESIHDERRGETAWVLGSGGSTGYIDPDFFSDKWVISTNFSAPMLGVKVWDAFSHYHKVTKKLAEQASMVVTLEKDTLSLMSWQGDVPDNVLFAPQADYNPPGSSWDPFRKHKPLANSLVYGSSSIHGAIHLAAHMGASHIVLLGADCGMLDGRNRFDDYETGLRAMGYPEGHTPWKLYDHHLQVLKRWIFDNYGVHIYSLNPFVNLNLEGHLFVGV
jgi:hypothetical protein